MEQIELMWRQQGGKVQVLCTAGQLRVLQLCLQEHQKQIYRIEILSFAPDADVTLREQAMQHFCDEAVRRGVQMIFSCRASQSWFAAHPERTKQLAANLKTKPGF